MVFQNYALYPHMSVFDNMAYGLRIRGLSRGGHRAAGGRGGGDCSGWPSCWRASRGSFGGTAAARGDGARDRAAIRSCSCSTSRCPTWTPSCGVQMRAEIRRLQRRLGVTSLYVTHDQVEAMTLGDRLLVLHQGRPAQLATPMEVFARPADTYVAGFIGATDDELPACHTGPRRHGGAAGCRPAAAIRRRHGARARMATGSRSASARNTWFPGAGLAAARSTWSSRSGPRPWCTAGCRRRRQPLVVKLAGPSAGGERLSVAPAARALHVFDRASGRRIDPIGEENMASRACRCGHG